MFLTKKHLSRRAVLRGAGAVISLPFLDAMAPAQTPLRLTAAAPRSRLACIEMVHGSAGSTPEGSGKHYWSPTREGSEFELSYCLEPLALTFTEGARVLGVTLQGEMRFADRTSLSDNDALEPVVTDDAAPQGIVEIEDKTFL